MHSNSASLIHLSFTCPLLFASAERFLHRLCGTSYFSPLSEKGRHFRNIKLSLNHVQSTDSFEAVVLGGFFNTGMGLDDLFRGTLLKVLIAKNITSSLHKIGQITTSCIQGMHLIG